MTADPLSALLERLGGWLARELPEARTSLRPGAAEEEFAALERLLGRPLPSDFRRLYAWHDGQASDPDGPYVAGIFCGLDFLPLGELLRAGRFWQEELTGQPELAEETPELSAFPAGAVRPVWASPGWLRFADDGGGSFLAVDLDPGPAGTTGQVISLERSGGRRTVLAQGLGGFLGWLVGQYEAGNFSIREEDGERILTLETPSVEHFLDAVPELFGAAGADKAGREVET